MDILLLQGGPRKSSPHPVCTCPCDILSLALVIFSLALVYCVECYVAGVAGSKPARGMNVCLLCLYVVLSCVGRGLCGGLIIRREESYRVPNCITETPKGALCSSLEPTGKWMIYIYSRSHWPRGLRRRSVAVMLLGSRVRIPLGAWLVVSCVYMLCCPV
jgi:hypothetical protein